MNIGPTEIILVLVIALLVFGPSRLPQMGRSLGRGIREFRKAAETAKDDLGLGEITDQINDVKATFTEPIRDVTSTVSDLTSTVGGASAAAAAEPAAPQDAVSGPADRTDGPAAPAEEA